VSERASERVGRCGQRRRIPESRNEYVPSRGINAGISTLLISLSALTVTEACRGEEREEILLWMMADLHPAGLAVAARTCIVQKKKEKKEREK